jgi:hypothetical protein
MLTTTLPAYLYQQYNNDPDLLAFFTAYNNTSQQYLDNVNDLNLPIYTVQSGPMLDWVGNGLYGIARPVIPFGTSTLTKGVYDSDPYDTRPYNQGLLAQNGIAITSMSWSAGVVTATTASAPPGIAIGNVYVGSIFGVTPAGYNGVFSLTQTGTTTFTYPLATNPGAVTIEGKLGTTANLASDDIYQRVITWNFYRGDGYQFNVSWLKNRVYRFLAQANGQPAPIPNTYAISVSFSSGNAVTIHIGSSLNANAPILQALINSSVLQLPFQYVFNVTY